MRSWKSANLAGEFTAFCDKPGYDKRFGRDGSPVRYDDREIVASGRKRHVCGCYIIPGDLE